MSEARHSNHPTAKSTSPKVKTFRNTYRRPDVDRPRFRSPQSELLLGNDLGTLVAHALATNSMYLTSTELPMICPTQVCSVSR
jgi:hypothetical protein